MLDHFHRTIIFALSLGAFVARTVCGGSSQYGHTPTRPYFDPATGVGVYGRRGQKRKIQLPRVNRTSPSAEQACAPALPSVLTIKELCRHADLEATLLDGRRRRGSGVPADPPPKFT